MPNSFYCRYGKRCFDAIVSGIALLLLSPIFLVIACAVKWDSAGPAFFSQERMGLGGRPFRLYKFRSMRVTPSNIGPLVTASNDTRITRVGRVLRNAKLDELPQLLNVFLGHMSFVGPRPEVRRYAEKFPAEYAEILTVRPGITDDAAIQFLNEEVLLAPYPDREKAYLEIVLPQKIELYRKTIHEMAFVRDLALIWKTLSKGISG